MPVLAEPGEAEMFRVFALRSVTIDPPSYSQGGDKPLIFSGLSHPKPGF